MLGPARSSFSFQPFPTRRASALFLVNARARLASLIRMRTNAGVTADSASAHGQGQGHSLSLPLQILSPSSLHLPRSLPVHRPRHTHPTPPFLRDLPLHYIETCCVAPPRAVITCDAEPVVVRRPAYTAYTLHVCLSRAHSHCPLGVKRRMERIRIRRYRPESWGSYTRSLQYFRCARVRILVRARGEVRTWATLARLLPFEWDQGRGHGYGQVSRRQTEESERSLLSIVVHSRGNTIETIEIFISVM